MRRNFQKTKLVSLMLICFLISGCSVVSWKEKLQYLDQRAGEMMADFQNKKIADVLNDNSGDQNSVPKEDGSAVDIHNLSEAQKIKVDDWLKEHDLNRYGDPEGTFYAGGTPLFDEITGLSIERYYYILKNHPEIVEALETE